MGMDINGRKPSSSEGEYFGVNYWAWAPIHHLIGKLCSDLVDEEMIVEMSGNSGAGPKDQETCTQMASRFDRWMEHNIEGLTVDGGMRVDNEGRLYSAKDAAAQPELEIDSPYRVSDELIKKWIEFLRHCGGFEVF